MKKSILLLPCVFMSYFLMAQEPVKQKEIGLAFRNLHEFGLTFKTGNDKSLWRFNSLYLSGSETNYETDKNDEESNRTGFEVGIGKEYRKKATEKLELRYGADLSFSYVNSKSFYTDKTGSGITRLTERTYYSPGINLVLGLNYLINDHLVLGAEILPNFSYISETSIATTQSPVNNYEVKSDVSGFSYGLSSRYVLLSLVYRF